ncbi:MAG TPA: hypothetical protein VIS55_15580 [Pseudomonadales bacterium]|jgi:catalase (peroxidase I)
MAWHSAGCRVHRGAGATLYLQNLLNFDWEQTRSPAGAIIRLSTDGSLRQSVPDAHVVGKFNPPVMTTADLALKFDPEYRKVAERFLADPDACQRQLKYTATPVDLIFGSTAELRAIAAV